jgi:hypothetical protein
MDQMKYITGCLDTEKILIDNLEVLDIITLCTVSQAVNSAYETINLVIELKKCLKESGGNLIDVVSKNGYVALLKWLLTRDKKLTYTANAFDKAVINGHIDMIKLWLTGSLIIPHSKIIYETGSINILNLLLEHKNRLKPLKHNAMEVAASSGRIDIMQWWVEKDCLYLCQAYKNKSIIAASRHGYLNVLIWSVKQFGTPMSGTAKLSIIAAHKNAHIDILEWWQDYATKVKHRNLSSELILQLRFPLQ